MEVAAGEVAVAVVVVAVEVEAEAVGQVATTTPFATVAGKRNDLCDDMTLGNGLPRFGV